MITKLRDYIWNKDNEEYLAREKYSPYALQQARNIVKYWTIDKAKHREFVEWISIDAKESKDLDDAIWAEKYSNWYKVWIHISDPTENIKKYSPLDLEALKRTTSIYRTNDILNMYPPELANDIFSLNEWREKLTISVEVDLDFEWNIKKVPYLGTFYFYLQRLFLKFSNYFWGYSYIRESSIVIKILHCYFSSKVWE